MGPAESRRRGCERGRRTGLTRRHQASGGRRRDVESYFCLIGHHETYLFKGCHTKYFHTVSQYSFIMVCVSFVVASIQSFKNQFRLLHKVNNLKEELQKLSLCVTRKKYQNIQERYKFCRYNCSKTWRGGYAFIYQPKFPAQQASALYGQLLLGPARKLANTAGLGQPFSHWHGAVTSRSQSM